eukprot:6214460-Pleurochrysis_carterae.AAC.1
MTARTVGISDSEPFQSATMQGYRGSWKKPLKPYKNEAKCKTAKQEWHAKPDERFINNSVLNCEDTAVSRSSRPRFSSGGWRLNTKYRGYSGEKANLMGTDG